MAILRFYLLMKSFVEMQQTLDFEILVAESAFERAFDGVNLEVASHVFLRFESLCARSERALNCEVVAVRRLVSKHVGFLDEGTSTNAVNKIQC